jgi:hypothetical protein
LYLSAEQVGKRGRCTTIRNVDHLDAGHHLEKFAGQMWDGANAIRRHIDLAWIGLGVRNEFGNRLCRDQGVHYHDVWQTANAGDGRNVVDEIEAKIVVKRGVGRVRRGDQQERVAVRGRTHDRLSSDIGPSTESVFDDERLAKPF